MWAHLQRQVCRWPAPTVERLVRVNGWRGVTRRKKRHTIRDRPRTTSEPVTWSNGLHAEALGEFWVAWDEQVAVFRAGPCDTYDAIGASPVDRSPRFNRRSTSSAV